MAKVLFATSDGFVFGNVDGRPRTCVVGRLPSCDFVIGIAEFSRKHFSLRVNDNGDLIVADLKSKNGTVINGVKLVPVDENASLAASPEPEAMVAGEFVFKIGVDKLTVCDKPFTIEKVPAEGDVQGHVIKMVTKPKPS